MYYLVQIGPYLLGRFQGYLCFHSKEKAPEYNQETSLDKVTNL